MNKILRNTHKKSNIELLIARDYWFEKARKLWMVKMVVLIVPSLLLLVSYLPLNHFVLAEYRDYIVGLLTIISWFVLYKVDNAIGDILNISNYFRDQYDVNVLELKPNPYNHGYLEEMEEKKQEGIKKSKEYKEKYEYWYGEKFLDDKYHDRNVLVCQMDNLLYSLYIYDRNKKIYQVAALSLLVIVLICGRFFGSTDNFLLAIFSVAQIEYELFSVVILSKSKSNEIEEIKRIVLSDCEEKFSKNKQRCLQDYVMQCRRDTIFVPKFVRDLFLKDDSSYYESLNDVRAKKFIDDGYILGTSHKVSNNRYYKNHDELNWDEVLRPIKESDIEILDVNTGEAVPLKVLHKKLKKMLDTVVRIFDENEIDYVLDGGTLIGAMRSKKVDDSSGKHGFIPWDDDVDIAIPFEQIEKAKKILSEKFKSNAGDLYAVQDASDIPYSPRLSNFRVRLRDGVKVSEKDSVLFSKYKEQGLFIDVYAVQRTIKWEKIDRLYRRTRICPANKRLQKAEEKYKQKGHERGYKRAKKKYMKICEQYQDIVRWSWLNPGKYKEKLSYSPNFINNLKKEGPYWNREWFYEGGKFGKDAEGKDAFEKTIYKIPVEAELVLNQVYGDYRKIPTGPKTMLKHLQWIDMGEKIKTL